MKTMKCSELGGPSTCNVEFHANTWEEMKQKSMDHGKEMFAAKDQDHLEAMKAMQEKMQNPETMQNWMDKKEKEFNELPEDN